MNKNQAAKKKAEWMAYCLDIGFIEKSQLDELSALWDKHKDENGNLRPNAQQFAASQPIADAVEVLKGYEQWEADILSEDKLWWPYRADDVFRGKLYDTMLELQAKRNEVLKAASTPIADDKKTLADALEWFNSLTINERQNIRWRHGTEDGYLGQEKMIELHQQFKASTPIAEVKANDEPKNNDL